MSDPRQPNQSLPANPSLEQLHKQAKDLIRQFRAGEISALDEFRDTVAPTLADAQFHIARQYGFETWAKLKQHVEELHSPGMEIYERLAQEVATAYAAGDAQAIQTLNNNSGCPFVHFKEPEKMQQRLATWWASESRDPALALADAKKIVAHAYGFGSWHEFAASVGQPVRDPRSAPVFLSSTPPFYRIDWERNRMEVRGPQTRKNWRTIFDVIKEHRITGIAAAAIDDRAMAVLATLANVTEVHLGGNEITDAGFLHLRNMPQLRNLEFGGWTSRITDRALEPLTQLTELRRFVSTWTQGISDQGLSGLAGCEHLEEVNLMGTPAGDRTLQTLTAKPRLRRLYTGRNVTDAGLKYLHDFPVFSTWQGEEPGYGLLRFDSDPNFLLLDGPFTDDGLRSLAGLDGLFGLSFFWHSAAFTGAGIGRLCVLPNLGMLGCQGERCDDEAMRHIAELPNLRMLMAQGTIASDAGFAALSRSRTIEHIWGRECPNLGSAGFRALSRMSALEGLAVSCSNVDDAGLSLLPYFPALTALMPMDFNDKGFRHVGKCQKLEKLWCMYCRETGDPATEQIADLKNLKFYYAGNTKITDYSLELLSRMGSLEKLEFWECVGITDEGMAHLVRLPSLREISIDGFSGVSRNAADLFAPSVKVNYNG